MADARRITPRTLVDRPWKRERAAGIDTYPAPLLSKYSDVKDLWHLPPVAFRRLSAARKVRTIKRPDDLVLRHTGRRGTGRHLLDRHRKYFSGHRLGAGFRTTPALKYTLRARKETREIYSNFDIRLLVRPIRPSREPGTSRVRRPQTAGHTGASNRFELCLPSTRAIGSNRAVIPSP